MTEHASDIMVALIDKAPFGGFCIIVIVVLAIGYRKNLKIISKNFNDNLDRITKVYDDCFKKLKEEQNISITKKVSRE